MPLPAKAHRTINRSTCSRQAEEISYFIHPLPRKYDTAYNPLLVHHRYLIEYFLTSDCFTTRATTLAESAAASTSTSAGSDPTYRASTSGRRFSAVICSAFECACVPNCQQRRAKTNKTSAIVVSAGARVTRGDLQGVIPSGYSLAGGIEREKRLRHIAMLACTC